MNGVKLDGTLYHVRVVFNTLEQAFELMEGPNAGDMLSGRHERDLQGTAYSYQFGVERDPAHPDDYDAFFWAVSAPVDSHTVEMPSVQSTMTFEAMIQSGRHVLGARLGNRRIWTGLVVSFKPIAPQRVPV